jgi:hemoglobin
MSAGIVPLTQPRAAITEPMIIDLVHGFYERVLADEQLGPIFRDRLGHRWDEHLATMVDFWSSVALSTGRYGGKPHMAHQSLGLAPEHFQRWLTTSSKQRRRFAAMQPLSSSIALTGSATA